MAEIVLNLDSIGISLAGRPIFNDLSWELQRDQRVGLVGPNGAGKSTLMKIMAQDWSVDSGNIYRKPGLTWGRLEQEPSLPPERTVLQEAMTAVPRVAEIERSLEALEQQMGQPQVYGDSGTLEKVMRQHEKMLADYERLDGARYASKVRETLTALGLDASQWETLTGHLSGGQKKLIMLAKLLVQEPELLLLDEPDNHLDLPAKRNLEKDHLRLRRLRGDYLARPVFARWHCHPYCRTRKRKADPLSWQLQRLRQRTRDSPFAAAAALCGAAEGDRPN